MNKYNKDRTKSYEFSKEHKTPMDDTDISNRKFETTLKKIPLLFDKKNSTNIKLASECKSLSDFDVCMNPPFKRTKEQCKICDGNF